MKFKIRVTHTQNREVPIYKYAQEDGREFKTKEVLEIKTYSRNKILFTGSEAAYEIWKSSHHLPANVKIEHIRKLD